RGVGEDRGDPDHEGEAGSAVGRDGTGDPNPREERRRIRPPRDAAVDEVAVDVERTLVQRVTDEPERLHVERLAPRERRDHAGYGHAEGQDQPEREAESALHSRQAY